MSVNPFRAMSSHPSLYPPIEPFKSGFLQVSSLHNLYYEVCGNPQGQPIIYLHGGPGGGISSDDRRYFDPKHYKIVLLDQRGAGKSTPSASLEDNTTWALVSDIEKLRIFLGITKWLVFGGSWGSTLSIAYAETHPDRVSALILRGIFLLRRSELLWFYQEGASHIYPEYWEPYLNQIHPAERGDMISAYYKKLTGPNPQEQLAAAKVWSTWEMATSKLYVDPSYIAEASEDEFALAFARIECHYFINAGFFKYDGQLLSEVHKIRHIPCTIVQGRYDLVCPMKSAFDLHKAWPESELQIINDAGHSAKENGTTAALVAACDKYRSIPVSAPVDASTTAFAGVSTAVSRHHTHRFEPAQAPVPQTNTPIQEVSGLEHRHHKQPPGGKSSLIFG